MGFQKWDFVWNHGLNLFLATLSPKIKTHLHLWRPAPTPAADGPGGLSKPKNDQTARRVRTHSKKTRADEKR